MRSLMTPALLLTAISALAPHNDRSIAAPRASAMPARWAKVHDCERPTRWREALDDHDCQLLKEEETATRTGRPAPAGTNYTELIPPLSSLDGFLAAAAASERRDRLVVVKFYSRQCRACRRIAARYRRLALDLAGDIDCYEVESLASRPLVEALGVTTVPCVQIYDPRDVTRLANARCLPTDFAKVEQHVRTAMASMAKRRTLHAVVGTPCLAALRDAPTTAGGKAH
jgi:thiol-disulfide isomerase/thioredoxin